MLVNIATCMLYEEHGFGSSRTRCKHLDKGVFGGYVCKRGHQIDFIAPRIASDNQICNDKEISKLA